MYVNIIWKKCACFHSKSRIFFNDIIILFSDIFYNLWRFEEIYDYPNNNSSISHFRRYDAVKFANRMVFFLLLLQ